MDLQEALPELKWTCDLNGEKNATQHECLTKPERSPFLRRTPLFVGTSLGDPSVPFVRGKGCFDTESIALERGGSAVRCGLFSILLRVAGHSQNERGTFGQRSVEMVMFLPYVLITLRRIPNLSTLFVKAGLLPEPGLSALSFLSWEK